MTKLHKNIKELEAKEYASASVYGATSIQAAMEIVSGYLHTNRENLRQRKNGHYFKDVIGHLEGIEDEALANIALKRTFDCVFSTKYDGRKRPNSVSAVTTAIGAAVEAVCQIRWYEEQDPEVVSEHLSKYWHSSAGTQQKESVMRLMMNRNNVHWDRWSTAVRARLGCWMLDAIMESTGWFEKRVTMEGKPKLTLVVPTPIYDALQEKLVQEAELFSPCQYPMLIPPNDWSNDKQGGYLLNELMLANDLVRQGNPTIIQGDIPIDFLNRLQKTAYRLNDFVHTVAKELDERGTSLGSSNPCPMPPTGQCRTNRLTLKPMQIHAKLISVKQLEANNLKAAYIRSLHVEQPSH